ncbi:hypothetical protein BDW22DRAFT_1418614 [Trametopsis cervina]|nr:hypothetical protein BDW22DRAFT_1418614 [Trametopsis cervina]
MLLPYFVFLRWNGGCDCAHVEEQFGVMARQWYPDAQPLPTSDTDSMDPPMQTESPTPTWDTSPESPMMTDDLLPPADSVSPDPSLESPTPLPQNPQDGPETSALPDEIVTTSSSDSATPTGLSVSSDSASSTSSLATDETSVTSPLTIVTATVFAYPPESSVPTVAAAKASSPVANMGAGAGIAIAAIIALIIISLVSFKVFYMRKRQRPRRSRYGRYSGSDIAGSDFDPEHNLPPYALRTSPFTVRQKDRTAYGSTDLTRYCPCPQTPLSEKSFLRSESPSPFSSPRKVGTHTPTSSLSHIAFAAPPGPERRPAQADIDVRAPLLPYGAFSNIVIKRFTNTFAQRANNNAAPTPPPPSMPTGSTNNLGPTAPKPAYSLNVVNADTAPPRYSTAPRAPVPGSSVARAAGAMRDV